MENNQSNQLTAKKVVVEWILRIKREFIGHAAVVCVN